MLERDGPHDQPQRHNVIGCFQRFGVSRIDLVLSGSYLVMGGLYLKSKVLKRDDHVAACVLPGIHRREVKVAALVLCLDCGPALFVKVEQEKLRLSACIHAVSQGSCLSDGSL